ncbi:hypothetical protein ACLB2K_002970 [Fragaria x ananassa]
MKTCLGVDEEIVHVIENGTLPTANPPQPQQQAAEQQNQQKAKRVESYEVFRHRKDAEAVVGFHSGECAICLGEYEEDDECVMLKKFGITDGRPQTCKSADVPAFAAIKRRRRPFSCRTDTRGIPDLFNVKMKAMEIGVEGLGSNLHPKLQTTSISAAN